MPVFGLAMAALVVGFEWFVQASFGPVGVVALVFLAVGLKAGHTACSCVGAAMLAVLVAQLI
ncbi:hypothetical protein G5C51_09250 [Streptomyces sp. A7024]|uniref:Uncharacterized protein n=1 Tax=Streptomyces coryli TaxID=1128680 RepID=A0A6G4TY93_9ACTN|nr:hypothetical protein [Streptomyces coryli]NGN64088.1 hypothetical protein [Streptomyces coryli]